MAGSSHRRRLGLACLLMLAALPALKRSGGSRTRFRALGSRFITRRLIAVTTWLDQRWGWDALPLPLGLLTFIGMREALRNENFYPTVDRTQAESGKEQLASFEPRARALNARTPDGSFNNLACPMTGRAGTRFARNFPPASTFPEVDSELLTPNPRTVSRMLLTRDEFIPVTSVNLLAAAWLQFMIHGFFTHGKNEKANRWEIPLETDDPWPERPLTILRTTADPTQGADPAEKPPTFINRTTHWWDASQIYGDDEACEARLRSGVEGTLLMDPNDLLPVDPVEGLDNEYGLNVTGVSGNWWIGLSLLHTLFTREHNAICDRLHAEYPSWSDDDLYDHARLINSALLAKIFMVEWTPVITGHPTAVIAARAAWWGLAGEQIHKRFGRITKNAVISGIPGSPHRSDTDLYAITEELVAIYRMHPFLPDTFSFRSHHDDRVLAEVDFPDVAFRASRKLEEQIPMEDLFYSFCTMHPGALTLHNYPKFLHRLDEPDGSTVDMATTDILRTRERGTPRYNAYRRLIRRPPVRNFEELTDNEVWREELREVYQNDVEKVDLVVGLFAERPPNGFAISDSAYRLFVLMTSMRLEADRFFTTDYRPEIYSPVGMQWIADATMSSVILRHYPSLAPLLSQVKNAFLPWPKPA